jgi:hypothetical protein
MLTTAAFLAREEKIPLKIAMVRRFSDTISKKRK